MSLCNTHIGKKQISVPLTYFSVPQTGCATLLYWAHLRRRRFSCYGNWFTMGRTECWLTVHNSVFTRKSAHFLWVEYSDCSLLCIHCSCGRPVSVTLLYTVWRLWETLRLCDSVCACVCVFVGAWVFIGFGMAERALYSFSSCCVTCLLFFAWLGAFKGWGTEVTGELTYDWQVCWSYTVLELWDAAC